MAKRKTSESNSQSEERTSSSSESEEEEETVRNVSSTMMSEYEKQRLERIAENKARLKAMGLPQMVSSLKSSTPIKKNMKKKKGKEKVEDDDEEYIPQNEEEREHDHDESDSSGEQHQHDSVSRKRKAKNKSLKVKSRVTGKKNGSNLENVYVDEEDEALMQAIALSLQDSADASFGSNKTTGNISKAEKKGSIQIQEDKGRKKNKKSFASRLQMTEDELIVHFFQLDEAGKGTVTIRDLEKAAITHDFSWTDKELVDMIRCFDSDGDGRLSLDDFRKIVVRCNMIKGPENS